jgi:hypothetical protein
MSSQRPTLAATDSAARSTVPGHARDNADPSERAGPTALRFPHVTLCRAPGSKRGRVNHLRSLASQGCSACVAVSASRSHLRCSGVMTPIVAAKSASSFGPEPFDLYSSTTSGARRGRPRPIKNTLSTGRRMRGSRRNIHSPLPLSHSFKEELDVKAVGPGRVHLVNRQREPFRRFPRHELPVDHLFNACLGQALAQPSLIVP